MGILKCRIFQVMALALALAFRSVANSLGCLGELDFRHPRNRPEKWSFMPMKPQNIPGLLAWFGKFAQIMQYQMSFRLDLPFWNGLIPILDGQTSVINGNCRSRRIRGIHRKRVRRICPRRRVRRWKIFGSAWKIRNAGIWRFSNQRSASLILHPARIFHSEIHKWA